MAIDYTHKDDLELYVRDNIQEINRKISQFKIDEDNNPHGAIYSDLDIKRYLKNKLVSEFEGVKDSLVQSFEDYNRRY